MNDTMETALCIVVASYFAFAFRDVQSVLYLTAVAYVLHTFVRNPRLFSNGPATTTTTNNARIVTTPTVQHVQAPVAGAEKKESTQQLPRIPAVATPITPQPVTAQVVPSTRSSKSTPRAVQRKPSRYTFDPVNGGVVHTPLVTPPVVPKVLAPVSRPSSPPTGTKRQHRVPAVSAGKSPVLPIRSTSPVSAYPNDKPELPSVVQADVVNRVVHTEMVMEPKAALEAIRENEVEKHLHRRGGSHHHHHHSHSHSHHRRRSSRSPISFSDASATVAGSYDHDYDSDSSRASTSSTRSTTSTHKSFGLPSYEKHYTMILTLNPKRAGYLPQIQSILKAVRPYWLSLPGSVSHEVGHDTEAGTIVVVETYESKEDVTTFEQSKEREKMLARIKPFVDESKTTVTRLPSSSAATRYR